MNLEFSLGSASKSHVGPYYLLKGSPASLQALIDLGVASHMAPQTHSKFLQSPRDISIPEINADDVWLMLDELSQNITGKDILIADLDSGVDWRHPDLWFPDGGTFDYVNSTNTGFVNGSDGVDINGDMALSPNETLYHIDLDGNGVVNTRLEWLWVDK